VAKASVIRPFLCLRRQL